MTHPNAQNPYAEPGQHTPQQQVARAPNARNPNAELGQHTPQQQVAQAPNAQNPNVKADDHEHWRRRMKAAPTAASMDDQTRRDEQSEVAEFAGGKLTLFAKTAILDAFSIKPLGTREGVQDLLFEETKLRYNMEKLKDWFEAEADHLIKEIRCANPARYNKHNDRHGYGIPLQGGSERLSPGTKFEIEFDPGRHQVGQFYSAQRLDDIANGRI
ncbi:hypothetical protein GLAREA_09494 [Glarea lozoyensis ATCC 20868]|uniref:Uncharacterized protein n=1 Tax=Glarea lozoyensis (strain ATCC 20868 / MF5171) TaxID=1116229 RepID=S3CTM3_GLAL2|nr:uncharacterized protein GLAREA_09494 [Glarea lozoyensis ATCC 20868]EPE28374.1 hypothetical protein GLAREA_09494 [Glarea lozoyensis ATCC 20868]